MNPIDDMSDPGMAALNAMSTKMRRGRFRDALPEEEQREITLILTPGGGAEVVSDSGAVDGPMEEAEEAMGQETSTGEPPMDEDEELDY